MQISKMQTKKLYEIGNTPLFAFKLLPSEIIQKFVLQRMLCFDKFTKLSIMRNKERQSR